VRIVARSTLLAFATAHADAAAPLEAWYRVARRATWKTPAAVKASDPRVSIIGNDRVVFDAKGAGYRLVVAIHYRAQIAFIRFIGTHAEYDDVDATTV
jgi:mRNA interferase HigB